MKPAIQIEFAILINSGDIVNKLCLNGIPIANYNIAEIKRLFINNQWVKVLDFKTTVAIWGGVNVHYLVDCNQEIQDFDNVIAFINDEYFYQSLFDKATTENLYSIHIKTVQIKTVRPELVEGQNGFLFMVQQAHHERKTFVGF